MTIMVQISDDDDVIYIDVEGETIAGVADAICESFDANGVVWS